jgi:galactokinase/mevalonate kinase-like predicted kinase
MSNLVETLLSVPPAAVLAPPRSAADGAVFAASDPPGRQLGSGGGTAHLLHAAWQATGEGLSFSDWLGRSRKLIVHGSGQSRRLPAYAAEGKLMLPLPTLPTITGQRPDQTLLDVQRSDYERIFRHAPSRYRVMVTCGDVLVRTDRWVPRCPEADVLIVGLRASPEEASNHGVMFCDTDPEDRLAFFLQKPTPARIVELSRQFACSLDTGVWLLSERAVGVLLRKCGWDSASEAFRNGMAGAYELFDQFGLSLGRTPTAQDPEVGALTCAVLPLPEGRFYHFGTNRSVFASLAQLSHPAESRRSFGHASQEPRLSQVVLNATVARELPHAAVPLWIENADISAGWTLVGSHVLTGIPANRWKVNLPRGVCVDLLGVRGREGLALRVYGFDDRFKGALGSADTLWMGRPAGLWLAARGLTLADASLDAGTDLQDAALFPVVAPDESAGALLAWMVADTPAKDDPAKARWLSAPRVSATDLVRDGDVASRSLARRRRIADRWKAMGPAEWVAVGLNLDLEHCARLAAEENLAVPMDGAVPGAVSLANVHLAMFAARAAGTNGNEARAFELLRELIVGDLTLRPAKPNRNVLDDQIVWGRSPARLDLAGGWSDTPPYCLEHGGRVVNVAVNLNGQPPVQAFARICEEPHLVVHSIDLGMRETIRTYEELVQPSALGGFSIARAALRLAGFDPRFHADGGHGSLREQLVKEFGGGVELSMLAAIPKGSGLGTSSILAGTLLGVLGEVCGLGWSPYDLYARTSALEQILTSGGGWQDQIGGLAHGLKLIETQPGLSQTPEIRWLPDTLLREAAGSGRALLYYTGITRVARNILGEIVRGIFLNDRARIAIIEEIACNADYAANVVQRQDWEGLREVIRRSWRLNQALDAGTNPPAVQTILARIARWSPALKLLGAGGGGYMLMLAEDQEAAAGIREALRRDPPNASARFVDMSVSDTGLQITRS